MIASTYSWWVGNNLVDSDIVFWDGGFHFFTGTSGCGGSNGAYIEDIAVHEFGHALGLNHSTDTSATMYPSYSLCSQSYRTLAADDIAGVEFLYPPLIDIAPTVSIATPTSGASFAEGTSTAFSGSAIDAQDGTLTGLMKWTSSLDGTIGTGGSFSKVLSSGTHVITAKATDSGGLTGSQQVTVTVTSSSTVPSGRNVALATNGGVARASSVFSSGFKANTVINGDRKGLNWGTSAAWMDATAGVFPDWIEVEFSAARTIGRINVFSVQDSYLSPSEPTSTMKFTKYGLTDFKVMYRTPSGWTKVPGGLVSGNNLVWRTFSFAPITTKKIRVKVTRALASSSRVTEIEAFTS
jgi:hypothetical protein